VAVITRAAAGVAAATSAVTEVVVDTEAATVEVLGEVGWRAASSSAIPSFVA
jgi:hypothetical protein